MRTKGTNIILLNSSGSVLLYLRDNKPNIPYPNMWCLPGGLLEEGETPKECILREIKEEMGFDLEEIYLFSSADLLYGTEYTFWAKVDFAVEDIILTEGQSIKWFTEDEIKNTKLGYEDNSILVSFFKALRGGQLNEVHYLTKILPKAAEVIPPTCSFSPFSNQESDDKDLEPPVRFI